MKSSLLITALLLVGFLGARAEEQEADESHIFTSKDGSKRLVAKVLSHAEGKFTIELTEGKRRITVGPEAFSDPDQEYLRKWAAENISYTFRADTEKRKGNKSKLSSGGWDIEKQNHGYEVKLESLTKVELSGLEVRYNLFKLKFDPKTKSRSDAEVAVLAERAELGTLAARGNLLFTTKMHTLYEWDVQPGYHVPGGKEKFEDRLAGLWFKIYHRGKEVYEYKTSDSTVKNARWQEPKVEGKAETSVASDPVKEKGEGVEKAEEEKKE